MKLSIARANARSPPPHASARRTPSGMTPVSRYRHSATSNFRASATAITLRMRPLASPTRPKNQRLNALSGWNFNQRHVSCSNRQRTRVLPFLEMPCSRSISPLWNGVPVRPTNAAIPRRSRNGRLNTSRTSRVAVSNPIPQIATSRRIIAIPRSGSGASTSATRAASISAICSLATLSRFIRRRNWAIVCAGSAAPERVRKASSFSAAFFRRGRKSPMPCKAQQTLDLVLEPDALAHQLVALAPRTPRILLLDAGNAHHRAHPGLPAQPSQQRPQQHVQIDAIGFGSPPLALDGDARRLHDMRLDPSATQLARDPEPVASRLVSHNYPRDRLASPDRLRLPAIHHTHDFVHVTRLHARLRTPRDAGNHRSQLPGLAAQFHRHHQRAIVIEGGRGAVRIEKFSHRIAPFHEVCNHRISNPAAAPIESRPGHPRRPAAPAFPALLAPDRQSLGAACKPNHVDGRDKPAMREKWHGKQDLAGLFLVRRSRSNSGSRR